MIEGRRHEVRLLAHQMLKSIQKAGLTVRSVEVLVDGGFKTNFVKTGEQSAPSETSVARVLAERIRQKENDQPIAGCDACHMPANWMLTGGRAT